MDAAEDLVRTINQRLPDIKRGSLVVYGDVFGGRIDNIHIVLGAAANPDGSLAVQFNEGETLTVWAPSDALFSATEFRTRRATRVRWEWFFYGREKAPENRRYIEHWVEDGAVRAATDREYGSALFTPSGDRPAVELVGMM